MAEIKITHGQRTFVESDPPRKILHVVTTLPQSSFSRGFNAQDQHEMMRSIAARVFKDGFDGYVVHWSDDEVEAS
jgi:hypothetical protein